jgi:WD40 repeat protein
MSVLCMTETRNPEQVHERTVYSNIHRALLNCIRFLPWLDSMSAATAASDGTVKLTDVETGAHRLLLDVNPNGWIEVRGCLRDALWRAG